MGSLSRLSSTAKMLMLYNFPGRRSLRVTDVAVSGRFSSVLSPSTDGV